MKNRIKRDIQHRLNFVLFENDAIILKALFNNKILPLQLRIKARILLKNIPSITKIRNICVLTGRTRSIIRDYNLSRLSFRFAAENGYIAGIRRSTW